MTDKELIASLIEQVTTLTPRVKESELRLSKYENPKNSGNSGTAPSQDPFKTPKSLRVKSSKKPRAQKGHPGKKLEFSSCIDHIVVHDVVCCCSCGEDLPNESNTI